MILALTLVSCTPSAKLLVKQAQPPDPFKLKARDLYLQGIFLQQEGRYNEALVKFYQALHHDSTSATIYASIAENHLQLGHYESAEILLRKAFSLQPDGPEILSLMAECQLRLEHNDRAITLYKKMLQIDPYDNEARQYLLMLYERNGDKKGIARQNEEMLHLYGDNITLLVRLGKYYLNLKKYNLAEVYFKRAIKVDSTVAADYYFLGEIHRLQQQPQQAESFYKKALQYSPNDPQALNQLTFLYRTQHRWQAIIDLYRPRLMADSTSGPAAVFMAESYYYLEKYNQARRLLQPLFKKRSPGLSVLELMARIEYQAKHLKKAAKYFRQILSKNNKNKFAWLFLAFSLNDLDSTAAAEKTFHRALVYFPDDADVWAFYGNTLQNQKKYEPAIAAFRKALILDSLNTTALTGLPVIYETLKNFAACDSLYELGLKRLPDNDLLLNNYGYSLAERTIHLQRALQMVQKALQKKPDNSAYLDTMGWIYYKLGRFDEAEIFIKKSLKNRENSAVVLEHLGDVYFKKLKYDQARAYWLKSLKLKKNKQLLKKLKEIK